MTAQEQQMVDMLLKTNASQVELLSKQSKQIESLEQRIKELTAQIAWFQRQMFGRKRPCYADRLRYSRIP